MPAVTIVAACINAETGVGPAIASGNQVYNGIWADLPVAPIKSNNVIPVSAAAPTGMAAAFVNTSEKLTDPNTMIIQKIAIRKPKSPMRFMMNAFFAAFLYASFLNQYPIKMYEHNTTPS